MVTSREVLVEARTVETNRVILLEEGTSKLGGIIYISVAPPVMFVETRRHPLLKERASLEGSFI